MTELSEGLDLSDIGTTTREVEGITTTAMYLTGFEPCTPSSRPTTCWTSGPRAPAMDLGTGRGSAAKTPAGRLKA
jgi:hypothetical protein